MVPDGKLREHQSHYDSPSEEHESLYKFTIIVEIIQSGPMQWTDRH